MIEIPDLYEVCLESYRTEAEGLAFSIPSTVKATALLIRDQVSALLTSTRGEAFAVPTVIGSGGIIKVSFPQADHSISFVVRMTGDVVEVTHNGNIIKGEEKIAEMVVRIASNEGAVWARKNVLA